MTKETCYYLPKQIMTAEYASFSVESKMLFSIIFTNAKHIKTISETAKLIDSIGEKELYNMRHLFEESIGGENKESEAN